MPRGILLLISFTFFFTFFLLPLQLRAQDDNEEDKEFFHNKDFKLHLLDKKTKQPINPPGATECEINIGNQKNQTEKEESLYQGFSSHPYIYLIKAYKFKPGFYPYKVRCKTTKPRTFYVYKDLLEVKKGEESIKECKYVEEFNNVITQPPRVSFLSDNQVDLWPSIIFKNNKQEEIPPVDLRLEAQEFYEFDNFSKKQKPVAYNEAKPVSVDMQSFPDKWQPMRTGQSVKSPQRNFLPGAYSAYTVFSKINHNGEKIKCKGPETSFKIKDFSLQIKKKLLKRSITTKTKTQTQVMGRTTKPEKLLAFLSLPGHIDSYNNNNNFSFESNTAWALNDQSKMFEVVSKTNVRPNNIFHRLSSYPIYYYNNKVWLININGINSSSDGTTWQVESSSNTPWQTFTTGSAINTLGAQVIEYNEKLYLIGGDYADSSGNPRPMNTIWSSTNGINWVNENDGPWPARKNFGLIELGKTLYVAGGQCYDNINSIYYLCDDIWSYNGSIWSKVSDLPTDWILLNDEGRQNKGFVLNDKMYFTFFGSSGLILASSKDGVNWVTEKDFNTLSWVYPNKLAVQQGVQAGGFGWNYNFFLFNEKIYFVINYSEIHDMNGNVMDKNTTKFYSMDPNNLALETEENIGFNYLIQPTSPFYFLPLLSSFEFGERASCILDLKNVTEDCTQKGISNISFVKPLTADKRPVLKINLDPNQPFESVRFDLILADNPFGWLMNIGDSVSNNGWGGDSDDQSWDAEFEIKNIPESDYQFAIYGSDEYFKSIGMSPMRQGAILKIGNYSSGAATASMIDSGSNSVPMSFTVSSTGPKNLRYYLPSKYYFSSVSGPWNNIVDTGESINNLFGFGETDIVGQVNYDIYAAFNRVIDMGESINNLFGFSKKTDTVGPVNYDTGRVGTGVEKVLITFLPGSPSVTVLNPNGGEVWDIGETYTINFDLLNSNQLPLIYLDQYHSLSGSKAGNINRSQLISGSGSKYFINNNSFVYTPDSYVSPDTTYKVRICVYNNCLISDSSDNFFTIKKPTSTSPISSITVTTLGFISGTVTTNEAYIEGSFNNDISPVTTWFEYGPTTSFGFSTSKNDYNLLTSRFKENLQGLKMNTTYYFKACASDTTSVTVCGDTLTFKTPPLTFTVTTDGVSSGSITSNEAIINASYNSGIQPITGWFEYGITTSTGSSTYKNVYNLSSASFGQTLTGLLQNTTYYFKACASDTTSVTVCGDTLTFKTL